MSCAVRQKGVRDDRSMLRQAAPFGIIIIIIIIIMMSVVPLGT
jgi:hypothetical protein